MTDKERWEIQGRTRDQLRQTKQTIALLRADVSYYAHKLKEASAAIEHFVSNPTGSGPTGMSKPDYLVYFYETALAPIADKIRELANESERAEKLEKQIAEF